MTNRSIRQSRSQSVSQSASYLGRTNSGDTRTNLATVIPRLLPYRCNRHSCGYACACFNFLFSHAAPQEHKAHPKATTPNDTPTGRQSVVRGNFITQKIRHKLLPPACCVTGFADAKLEGPKMAPRFVLEYNVFHKAGPTRGSILVPFFGSCRGPDLVSEVLKRGPHRIPRKRARRQEKPTPQARKPRSQHMRRPGIS